MAGHPHGDLLAALDPQGATDTGLQMLPRGRTQHHLGPRAAPTRVPRTPRMARAMTECQSDSRSACSRGCTVRCAGSSRHPEEADTDAVQVVPSDPRPRVPHGQEAHEQSRA